MIITLKISRDTLGDSNTDEQNRAFAAAVCREIEREYPDVYRVYVDLAEHERCEISGCDDDAVTEIMLTRIREIAGEIWERGDY